MREKENAYLNGLERCKARALNRPCESGLGHLWLPSPSPSHRTKDFDLFAALGVPECVVINDRFDVYVPSNGNFIFLQILITGN